MTDIPLFFSAFEAKTHDVRDVIGVGQKCAEIGRGIFTANFASQEPPSMRSGRN
jgi:hypothetical protein